MAVDRSVSFGALLRGYRRRVGLSQRELAERAGLSVAAVRDLEQGRTRQPQPASVRALATALGVDEDEAVVLLGAAVVEDVARVRSAAEEPGLLRVDVLGPLTLRRGSVEVALGRGGRRVVLARLALNANAPVSVHELVDLLWGDRPPPHPHHLLQSHVSRLRLALGPATSDQPTDNALSLGTGGYRLVLAEQQLDVAEFRGLVGAAERVDMQDAMDLLENALRLWRGAPLADIFEMRDHPLVTALVQEYVTVALRYADLASQLGAHGRPLPRLRELAAAYPLHEPLHARLVTALAGAGLQADALAAYDTIRQRLADDLGIDPGPELTEAHRRLLRQEVIAAGSPPAGGRVVPAQLPAGIAGFVGRRDELDQLDKLLETGEATRTVVISAVSGMAGVGKTALAVHWAHQVADRFPDGQLYVNLRGFAPDAEPLDPAVAVRGFLEALAVPARRIPAGLHAQAALYRSVVAGRRILVVLDNAREAEQVRPLLPGTSTALVVVTSRSRLASLVAVDGACPLSLELLSTVEARQLLAGRMGHERLADELAAADDIVAACARLPLALVIAAAHVQLTGCTLASVADQLAIADQRLDMLDAGDAPSRVRAVFSWSYTTLPPASARLFRLLGEHPGPDISAPTAASLAGYPLPETQRLLADLVRANLLDEHLPGRYTFHDLLRAYAAELTRSQDSPEIRRDATRRILDHYTHTAYAADRLLKPDRDPITPQIDPPDALVTLVHLANRDAATRWLTAEHRVLLAAVHHAVHQGLDLHAWQLTWSTATFRYLCGYWHEQADAWAAALVSADRLADPGIAAHVHRGLAKTLTWLGRNAEARTHFEHALDLFARCGDLIFLAHTHTNLGLTFDREGNADRALEEAQRAAELFQRAGHLQGQAEALNAVGWCQSQLGDHRQALVSCQQALAMMKQAGVDGLVEAHTWDSLGHAHHHLGEHHKALDCYEQALQLRQTLGARSEAAATLGRLGDTHHATGNINAARHAWIRALEILTDLQHPDADKIRTKLENLDHHR